MKPDDFNPRHVAQLQAELIRWYESIAGLHLLIQENQLVAKGLEKLFGYHLVSLGPLQLDAGMKASPIAHKVFINDTVIENAEPALMVQPDDLALQNDSVDVLVLPHVLEFSGDPHAILREARRVVLANGHVVILGFNPLSCFGLCRLALGLRKKMPWRGHYYHPMRLKDWLKLLGFEICDIRYAAYTPPIQHQRSLRYLSFMEKASETLMAPLGGSYMIVARKLAITPNVMKPKWASQAALIKNHGAVEPSSRAVNQRART